MATKKRKLRFVIDDATDKDGETYFVYDSVTGKQVGDSFDQRHHADEEANRLNNPRYTVVPDEHGITFWVKDTQSDRRLRPEYRDEGLAQADADRRNRK